MKKNQKIVILISALVLILAFTAFLIFSLKDSDNQKIQVIERDDSGKIISYKIIRQDEDIANEIAVPKRGFFTEGGVVPFLEE